MSELIAGLDEDWLWPDQRIEAVAREIGRSARARPTAAG